MVQDVLGEDRKSILCDVPFYIFIQGVLCSFALVVDLEAALFAKKLFAVFTILQGRLTFTLLAYYLYLFVP